MKSLFEETAFKEIMERIDLLEEKSPRKWGKMTVGQMIWHCQLPILTAVKNKKPQKKGSLLAQWFFKKSMYNDKPMRKNLPTSSQLKAKETRDFYKEHKILNQLVQDLYAVKEREQWNPNPLFGSFTKEQWGKMQYKHLDHHLRQFGV
ncbi:hypothetical protein MNBD_BACTEROID03-2211 [hydrothermal vent metagenome]|uniref:DUF1569 domain-containing protein n=1 Tax=hydrothermal vent metagenome TaxID=652676 RepID=A0A3B0TXW4_9ZZZZ